MKINARDMGQPLLKKPKKRPTPQLDDPDSLRAKCKAAGMDPSTIKNRMVKHNLTVDEAIRWKPTPASACGKAGKKTSPWARFVPDGKGHS